MMMLSYAWIQCQVSKLFDPAADNLRSVGSVAVRYLSYGGHSDPVDEQVKSAEAEVKACAILGRVLGSFR